MRWDSGPTPLPPLRSTNRAHPPQTTDAIRTIKMPKAYRRALVTYLRNVGTSDCLPYGWQMDAKSGDEEEKDR